MASSSGQSSVEPLIALSLVALGLVAWACADMEGTMAFASRIAEHILPHLDLP